MVAALRKPTWLSGGKRLGRSVQGAGSDLGSIAKALARQASQGAFRHQTGEKPDSDSHPPLGLNPAGIHGGRMLFQLGFTFFGGKQAFFDHRLLKSGLMGLFSYEGRFFEMPYSTQSNLQYSN